jgi:hypothetical protein
MPGGSSRQPPQYPAPPQPYGPPRPQYPPQPYPAAQYAQPYGQPIVLPIEGKGAAKLAAGTNRRSLVISPAGFAHKGKKGAFRIAWQELRRTTITTAYHRTACHWGR